MSAFIVACDGSDGLRLIPPESYITPGAFRDVLVRVPTTLAAGRYVAIALLDYGGAEIKAAQVEFEIP